MLSLTDPWGGLVEQVSLKEENVFPDAARSYENTLGSKWMLGRYKVTLVASYGEKGQALERSIYFWAFPWKVATVITLSLIIALLFGRSLYMRLAVKEASLEHMIETEKEEIEKLREELKKEKSRLNIMTHFIKVITVIILITVITIISTKTVFAYTIGPVEMTVSAYVGLPSESEGESPKPTPGIKPSAFSLFGYTCPTCTVSVQNPGLYRSTDANSETGKFEFASTFPNTLVEDICLVAQDKLNRVTMPVCIPHHLRIVRLPSVPSSCPRPFQ